MTPGCSPTWPGGGYPPLPGAEDALRRLRAAGVSLALTTGFGTRIRDSVLAATGWDALVDTAISSEEVAVGRPAPALIHEAMRRTGVAAPTRVATVGDTASDLGSGRAAGVGWNVAVLTGSGTERDLG